MDHIGPVIASSLAGLSQAERVAARDAAQKDQRPALRFRKLLDNAELTVVHVEGAEAIRDPKGNDQEESHEDREEHGHYDSLGQLHQGRKPNLDIEV